MKRIMFALLKVGLFAGISTSLILFYVLHKDGEGWFKVSLGDSEEKIDRDVQPASPADQVDQVKEKHWGSKEDKETLKHSKNDILEEKLGQQNSIFRDTNDVAYDVPGHEQRGSQAEQQAVIQDVPVNMEQNKQSDIDSAKSKFEKPDIEEFPSENNNNVEMHGKGQREKGKDFNKELKKNVNTESGVNKGVGSQKDLKKIDNGVGDNLGQGEHEDVQNIIDVKIKAKDETVLKFKEQSYEKGSKMGEQENKDAIKDTDQTEMKSNRFIENQDKLIYQQDENKVKEKQVLDFGKNDEETKIVMEEKRSDNKPNDVEVEKTVNEDKTEFVSEEIKMKELKKKEEQLPSWKEAQNVESIEMRARKEEPGTFAKEKLMNEKETQPVAKNDKIEEEKIELGTLKKNTEQSGHDKLEQPRINEREPIQHLAEESQEKMKGKTRKPDKPNLDEKKIVQPKTDDSLKNIKEQNKDLEKLEVGKDAATKPIPVDSQNKVRTENETPEDMKTKKAEDKKSNEFKTSEGKPDTTKLQMTSEETHLKGEVKIEGKVRYENVEENILKPVETFQASNREQPKEMERDAKNKISHPRDEHVEKMSQGDKNVEVKLDEREDVPKSDETQKVKDRKEEKQSEPQINENKDIIPEQKKPELKEAPQAVPPKAEGKKKSQEDKEKEKIENKNLGNTPATKQSSEPKTKGKEVNKIEKREENMKSSKTDDIRKQEFEKDTNGHTEGSEKENLDPAMLNKNTATMDKTDSQSTKHRKPEFANGSDAGKDVKENTTKKNKQGEDPKHPKTTSQQKHDSKEPPAVKTDDRPVRPSTINLAVVACGDRLEEVLVMLKSSILLTRKPLHFYIFADDDLLPQFKERLGLWPEVAKAKFRATFRPIEFPNKDWQKLFKPCASQRLFLPSLLPDVKKLLYVDTDILFLRPVDDIWSFFDEFNSTQLAALAPEHEDKHTSWYARFARHPYYKPLGLNSGVMLMDMEKMREVKWLDNMLDYYKEYKLRIVWGDQDLINIFFSFYPDRVFIYPCQWNFRPDHCMYMHVCGPALKEGISVLHGNRGVYHDEKQPAFKAVYQSIRDFDFEDNLFNLLQLLQQRLQEAKMMKIKYPGCLHNIEPFERQYTRQIHLHVEKYAPRL